MEHMDTIIEPGGIVVLIDMLPPLGDGSGRGDPIDDWDGFINQVFNLPDLRIKEVAGPLINGLLVVTIEAETAGQDLGQLFVQAKREISDIWKSFVN